MQNNGLGYTILTQKTIIQMVPCSSKYQRKCEGLVWRKPNRHVFAHISGYGSPFELSFFALKPCVLARRFAYNKPYYFTNLILTL